MTDPGNSDHWSKLKHRVMSIVNEYLIVEVYPLIFIKTGQCIVIQNLNKLEAGSMPYFEVGDHVEWPRFSKSEST